MRFRANIEHVNTFYKISQAVEKLQKRCIIKFSENEMHIICKMRRARAASKCGRPSLFTDYRIQSNANNESICRSPRRHAAALRSAAAPSGQQAALAADAEVVMKCACEEGRGCGLTFEIATTTRMGRYVRMRTTSDRVLKLQDVGRLKEPCALSLRCIYSPPLAKLRAVVERMRPLAADVIGIRANLSGCLQLCAQTDNSRVDVSWNGLSNPRWDPDNSDARDPTTLYGVLVSLRSLQKFLSSHVVSTTTIACICQNHCIILYVYIGEMAEAGGILTFYIPAIIE
ncbi:checkpoint protein Hus1/Mec3 [Fomitopsis serialis]|uniref:checkpoint protein Hus1/Mec3 n=1 Tax=Fomitopsis serialis TaxID=139415 RepID=UPI0020087F69|nr:checkpoint protein Hus1/Mec3 [Neoantrodia serialis]KAH9917266.1 checkpoint protein Hus1/Mec3 [Neoantrodia serialis]